MACPNPWPPPVPTVSEPPVSVRSLSSSVIDGCVALLEARWGDMEDGLALLNGDHLLFSFLHLAAEPALCRHLQEIGLTAVAFETVEDDSGRLPLLAPMSDIAGRIATGFLRKTEW